MPPLHSIILYVENPLASAEFYQGLLGRPPVEASPGFALFELAPGTMLGLWLRQAVQPPAATPAGGNEIAFSVADVASVEHCHADWVARDLTIAQAPTALDFGHSFVARDPDGHRLRVFAPNPA